MPSSIPYQDKREFFAGMEDDTHYEPMEPKFVKPLHVESKDDPVNHPSHYTAGGIECIDAIEALTAPLDGPKAFAAGTAQKYLWRHALKGRPVEDLKKCRWYIDRLIRLYEMDTVGEGA